MWERFKDWYHDHIIKDIYHTYIPHEWRPGQIWYRTKCLLWKRYTTVKPRWLGHTWCDVSHLLPHTMFELLCRFIEDEKAGEVTDWDWCPEHAKAWKDLSEMYRWWLDVYIPWEDSDKYKNVPLNASTLERDGETGHCRFVYKSPEIEAQVKAEYARLDQEEKVMDEQLIKYCKRLIELKDYLWT